MKQQTKAEMKNSLLQRPPTPSPVHPVEECATKSRNKVQHHQNRPSHYKQQQQQQILTIQGEEIDEIVDNFHPVAEAQDQVGLAPDAPPEIEEEIPRPFPRCRLQEPTRRKRPSQ